MIPKIALLIFVFFALKTIIKASKIVNNFDKKKKKEKHDDIVDADYTVVD